MYPFGITFDVYLNYSYFKPHTLGNNIQLLILFNLKSQFHKPIGLMPPGGGLGGESLIGLFSLWP